MIIKDLIKTNNSPVYKWKEKKDFNLIIESISIIACLKKIDVKKMSSDEIISFTKKYASEIGDEYKRMEYAKKNFNLNKKEKPNKYW